MAVEDAGENSLEDFIFALFFYFVLLARCQRLKVDFGIVVQSEDAKHDDLAGDCGIGHTHRRRRFVSEIHSDEDFVVGRDHGEAVTKRWYSDVVISQVKATAAVIITITAIEIPTARSISPRYWNRFDGSGGGMVAVNSSF